MKRLGRVLFHASALISAVLLVVAVAAWVYTYRDARLLREHRRWVDDTDDGARARTMLLWATSGHGTLGVHRVRTSNDEFRYVEFYRRRLAEAPRFGEPPFGHHSEVSRKGIAPVVLPGSGRPVYGFEWQAWSKGGGQRYRRFTTVVVPYWAPVAALSLLPLVWVARLIARRRHAPGCCTGCGYDLRASPERCPECGRPTMQDARLIMRSAGAGRDFVL